ncbi:hypothetical protein HUA74_06860 [Myxococcus sp. CA051A]|uniref:NACHT domain-containing protein n=1 Tax=Myxococcus sp. CA051A TaxID=2741739 RepID=UPI00157A62ED|nr:hypothetical protein [Myxococcus sp. CA051A]NTX60376.1 hypothetical protein [Myxococcus sp. CA051A]
MEIASLWLDIDAPAATPPTVTREQTLPFGSLPWEIFERLCFRLAHRGGDVEDGRIYGERGQAQEGIDLYVRRTTGSYETWQCKRYQEFTATELAAAVTKFLDGDWAKRSKVFKLAVSASLNRSELAEEVERQRVRCNASNITFEPLDRNSLSDILKEHPDLVDDFFGRPWVEAFNGHEAATALAGRKLSREQRLNARRFLQVLYTTHFQIVDGGIPAAAPAFRGAVRRLPVFERYVEPDVELIEFIVENRQAPTPHPSGDASFSNAFRRREVRTKVPLSAGLAMSDRFLLLGGAGYGKSAALRVLTHSLLSDIARLPAVAKAWGQRLPLLLPFAFLTRHFAENSFASIESALNAWLKVLGAKSNVLALLEEMLTDERLLLLVDGLDEWQNREAAVTALTALTAYAQTRRLPLVAAGRPLGFERISDFGLEWKRANLLPLAPSQQREFATWWFKHFHETEASLDVVALEQAVTRDAAEFADELSEDPELSELGGVPLLLSVMIYLRLLGRVLPHSRLAALEELVKALLEEQPLRRAQAAMQRGDQSLARSPRIRRGIEYLAYRIHQEPNSLVLPNDRAAQLLRDYFHIDLELPVSEAEEWATRVVDFGQHEFGVLVPPQENHVGLLHRIFQEYLAAKYLSRLSLNTVKRYCAETGHKGPWHEVTLTLLQLLDRQDDVDLLIEELRKPVANCLGESGQQVLLARVAVADTNCSRNKAREIVSQVFTWLECGRWMPLRLALVQEVAVGLQSEKVGTLVASRAARWFPGRLRWLHEVPKEAAKRPTTETASDLLIALHNCDSRYDYRAIAEALATFSERSPELADNFLLILREPAEPELMAAALHALATGWPTHAALPALVETASKAPARELRCVALLTRFNRGDRSSEVRDGLRDFCLEGQWLWPWEEEAVTALATGWPCDPELKHAALDRIRGVRHPGSWAVNPAVGYLLQGCPGDDDVARMVATQLSLDSSDHDRLDFTDSREALLKGFAKHPLVVPAAEAWLDKNAPTHYSPMRVSLIAQLGGTSKCRLALLDWLRRGSSMPGWIISTLLQMSAPDDADLQSVLAAYMHDPQRRSEAIQWLAEVVREPKELGLMLREALHGSNIHASLSALTMLVDREGRDAPDLWATVQAKLENDERGHYWRLGHRSLLRIWPENPTVQQLAKSTLYTEDMSLSALYESYGSDPEIRPLLDRTLQVLHEDLRLEFARATEPLARRGVPSAVALMTEFKHEPNGEARTIAARACARACFRAGRHVPEMATVFRLELTSSSYIDGAKRQQAAVAGLLELGRADLVAEQREDGRPLQLTTHSDGHHNWAFVATVVEHWASLAAAMPDIWTRFDHSPVIASELAKAGKIAHALSQTQVFEDAVRTRAPVMVEHVRALIALHGHSAMLRDLFIARLQHYLPGRHNSMMTTERTAYYAMTSYLADHFHGDESVGQAMLAIAKSLMIGDAGLIALCRGWPDSPPIAAAVATLSTLIDSAEPFAAWLFASKADADLMSKYLMRYPEKLKRNYFGVALDGIAAVRARLESDRHCREVVFNELRTITEPYTLIVLTKLLAPSMRSDPAFRTWASEQLRVGRERRGPLCPLAFDVLGNTVKPVEFAFLEAILTRD